MPGMREKKWYSVELEPEKARDFRRFIQDKRFSYDSSGAWNLVHFEVLLTDEDLQECNDMLDSLFGNESEVL